MITSDSSNAPHNGPDTSQLPSRLMPLDRMWNLTKAKQIRKCIFDIGIQRNVIDTNTPELSEPIGDSSPPTIPKDPTVSKVPVSKKTNTSSAIFVVSNKISTQNEC